MQSLENKTSQSELQRFPQRLPASKRVIEKVCRITSLSVTLAITHMDQGNHESEQPKQAPEKTNKDLKLKAGSLGLTIITLGSSLLPGCSSADNSSRQSTASTPSGQTEISGNAKIYHVDKNLEAANNSFKKLIKEKYGINPEIVYLQKTYSSVVSKSDKGSTLQFVYDTYPGTLTTDEISETEAAFSKIPYFGKLIKSLSLDVVKAEKEGITSTMEYRISGSFDYASQRVEMTIPEDVNLDSEITKGWIEQLGIKLDDPITWKTNREDLQHTLIHEIGHAIANAVLRNVTGDPMGHRKEGVEFPESTNPLYRKFAEIEGMKLNGLRYENSGKDARILDRTNQSVQEYFAEMFSISRLKPELLRPEESIFFNELHTGLLKQGVNYLKTLK